MELRRIPSHLKDIYRANFNVIKTSIKRGRISDIYHFMFDGDEIHAAETESFIKNIVDEQTRTFKVNVSFGLILRNRLDDVLRFFHPSNNNRLFDRPVLVEVDDPEAVKTLANKISLEKIDDFAIVNRPSSNWTLERIVCIEFVVTKL